MSQPAVRLIKALDLPDFPSASSVNYHRGKLYLIGDDSTNILVLNSDYEQAGNVRLFDHVEKRIAKADKVDLESAAVILNNNAENLLILGSASRKNRKKIIVIPFVDGELDPTRAHHAIHKTKAFIKRIQSAGIEEINLEGIAAIDDVLVLGNRGNRSKPDNHLIITAHEFWNHQDEAQLMVRRLIVPTVGSHDVLGLSDLCYIKERDLLLVALTSEYTSNSYDDGEIGDSYIGLVPSASAKIQLDQIPVESLLNLSEVNERFKSHKIEGICKEEIVGDSITLHLVSDNDQGETSIFKILLDGASPNLRHC